MRTRFLFLCGAVVGVAVLGCKGGPKTTLHAAAPPKLADGWKTHETNAGFSMAGPYNWTLNPPSALPPISLGSDPGAPAPAEPPDVLSPEEEQRREGQGILLELFDKDVRLTPGETPTRLIVKKQDSSGTLAETSEDVKKSLGSDVVVTNVNLPIGPATKFEKKFKTIGGDELTNIVYLLVNGDSAYRFTFEATNNPEPIQSAAQPMMETVRFK